MQYLPCLIMSQEGLTHSYWNVYITSIVKNLKLCIISDMVRE